MIVRSSEGGDVRLEGHCPVEDAEALLQHLLADPAAAVDWTQCDAAHAAVVQVLLVSGAKVRGPPRSAFLKTHVAPLLRPHLE